MQCVTKYKMGSIFLQNMCNMEFTLCIIASFYAVQLNEKMSFKEINSATQFKGSALYLLHKI